MKPSLATSAAWILTSVLVGLPAACLSKPPQYEEPGSAGPQTPTGPASNSDAGLVDVPSGVEVAPAPPADAPGGSVDRASSEGARDAGSLSADGPTSIDSAAPLATDRPNYVFVTSTTYVPGELGGVAAADAACNDLARAAKLPGIYIAHLNAAGNAVASRLGSARGWIRVDGKPFMDLFGEDATDPRVLATRAR